jgi:hypothetical protein
MNVTMAYLGRSRLRSERGTSVVQLAPNLAREQVAFDAPLSRPLRFREGICTLHDVVVCDLRFRPKDKTAYQQWKQAEHQRLQAIRRTEYEKARQDLLARREKGVPADLERAHRDALKRYWQARRAFDQYLRRHDPALWRQIMPYDPVITVADDVVFLECFSADESSYGCLSVDREDGFGRYGQMQFGTTNVDYSWELYNHFQRLRSYRETRFCIDPTGFEVRTDEQPQYREEKIDLPGGWLRGFLQIQGAMGMPLRRVTLCRGAVYSLLAWLKRHKARRSPRAIRFELLAGRPPRLVLEPWEKPIVSHGTQYDGPDDEPVRIWGRRRLLVLARALPLAERIDVYLLGTGLPSFWLVHMGEMCLTVGLSGWTTNDWTRGSALDLLAPPQTPPGRTVEAVARYLRRVRSATFDEIQSSAGDGPATVAAALNHLAHAGQVIADLRAQRFRWRQVLPQAIGEAQMGPPSPELAAANQILLRRRVRVAGVQDAPRGGTLVTGKADGKPVELLMDGDGVIKRGRCVCGHHFKYGIRKGPCRHLLALRHAARKGLAAGKASTDSWFQRLQHWAGRG